MSSLQTTEPGALSLQAWLDHQVMESFISGLKWALVV